MSVRNHLAYWLPDSMGKAWVWVTALDQWDHGETAPLAELVRNEPIPDELRPILAGIVAGDRKPNHRAAAKLKIQAGERLNVAYATLINLGIINALQQKGTSPSLEENADSHRMEVSDLMRELEREGRQLIADNAIELGISEETLKKAIQELRKKIKDYPNI